MNWAATGCLGGYLRIWDLSTYQVRAVSLHQRVPSSQSNKRRIICLGSSAAMSAATRRE
jgi:hypothetical protein